LLVPATISIRARNADWDNNHTLFLADVYKSGSAMAHGNAGSAYFEKGISAIGNKTIFTHQDSVTIQSYCDRAIPHLDKAIGIYPKFGNAHINRALCYLFKNDLDEAVKSWQAAATCFQGTNPVIAGHATLLAQRGQEEIKSGKAQQGISTLKAATLVDPSSPDLHMQLGEAQLNSCEFDSAAQSFAAACQINQQPACGAKKNLAEELATLRNNLSKDPRDKRSKDKLKSLALEHKLPCRE
jgi:tetratricopeptide (TPR) repeat protein